MLYLSKMPKMSGVDFMSVKEKALEVLEMNRGRYVSGGEIASELHVSRNSVWKAVKALQKEGYGILTVTGLGYMLPEDTDILSAQGISKYLTGYEGVFDIDVRKEANSTNNACKELAAVGAREGSVVISERQTGGKRRLGRKVFSPERPKITASESLLITTAAAVAVAEAIEVVANRKAGIKWVNDVFLGNKKVCGILTEASFGMESGGLEYAVLGIGINVKKPEGGFPEEIREVADSVFDEVSLDERSRLTAEVLKRFWDLYILLPGKAFLDEYRKRSVLTGKEVGIVSGDKTEKAVVLGIDDDFRLVVRMPDGEERLLSTGEVSIRTFA
jgi:BirA family biotin operon repressor/biotin-[acetyl-CoA-carboxylase] ligase